MSNENNTLSGQNSATLVQSSEFCSEKKKCEETRDIELGDASKEVAQELTIGEILQTTEANDASFIKQNLVEEHVCNGNAKGDIILQNSKESKLELDEQLQNVASETTNCVRSHENPAILDVQQILLDVIDSATEKYTEGKNGCEFDDERGIALNQNREEMDTTENDTKSDVGRVKHGLKRTHEQAALGTSSSSTADDQSYVMTLVQEELSAVEKQIDNKEKLKIVDYDSDSSDDSSMDEESSESSTSDSESTISSESSTDDRIVTDKLDEKPVVDPPKTKDEILLNDLPPEPLVDIVLANDVNLVGIGIVSSIVECVVVIRALPKTPAVDADTLLFLENRKCVGKVFETFGPVQSPFYSVRFNSEDDIIKSDIKPDMVVYYAPEELDMTKLIFTSEIERYKGSDASWRHDQEPPVELIEYSDDEEEAEAKAKRKQERKVSRQGNQVQDTTPSQETTSKPSVNRKTWQGRGRGRGRPLQQNHPRLPPPGATHPPPISHSSFPAQPGQFMAPPFIPSVNPGQYMPPPPPSFNIPPPPLPHLSPHPVRHTQVPPFPIHCGQGANPAMHHGLGIPSHPPRHLGPGILPPPTNLPNFRNVPPPTMSLGCGASLSSVPLGVGACPSVHVDLKSPPPGVPPSHGGPQHAMPQGPPFWRSTFPPPRQ